MTGLLHGAQFGLPVLLSLAAVLDVRQRRIPNLLSLGGVVAGLTLWAWQSGMSGVLYGMAGLLVGGGLFLPFYVVRGMGAGDVKLMAAVGTFLGPYHVFAAAIVVALVGGAIAASVAFRQGRLRAAMRDSLLVIFQQSSVKTLEHADERDAIPYGLAIAVGVLFYLLMLVVS